MGSYLLELGLGVLLRKGRRNVMRTFVSSTFTDTENERNLLIADVYPYLQELGRRLDIEVIQYSEMR